MVLPVKNKPAITPVKKRKGKKKRHACTGATRRRATTINSLLQIDHPPHVPSPLALWPAHLLGQSSSFKSPLPVYVALTLPAIDHHRWLKIAI
jgi:hypothetical protein